MTLELIRTADSPPSTATQFDALRDELETQRRFRLAQIDDLANDIMRMMADGDEARCQVAQALTRAAETALEHIDAALCRLGESTYGICEYCHEPIPNERLEVLPMTRSCTPCRASAESGHRSHAPRRVRAAGPLAQPAP